MDFLNRTSRKAMTNQIDESTKFDFSSSIYDMKQGLSAAGWSSEEIKLFIQGQLNEIL